MELLAVIAGLEAIKKEGISVSIFSDSKYVVDSVEKGWVFEWERKRFKKKMNEDLWRRFLKVFKKHNVKFIWVKGHADNPENNLCDELAVAAAQCYDLKIDGGYENIQQDKNGMF